jgi:catechol 2,3-dioxygenase-like lactoylglutathione lyase family enzyme
METPLQIRRVILFVKNMRAVTDFYEHKLGLKVLSRSDGFVDFDAGAVRLALHSTGAANPGRTKLCFYAENVSRQRAELVARGVKMGKDPGEGLKLCDGKDPEGNVFQLSNRV